ncbi:Threonine synthase [Pseudomonas syringae pv. actinidiae]|uniref:Threonine synthase n=1 Tax=Pseudomonas syringae pv. actinidiae TaxID=103796 RepID=A0A2V0Q6A5_PSESF|nr:Threonine synthase [Pseudomonas syringae pv. actinidiae]
MIHRRSGDTAFSPTVQVSEFGKLEMKNPFASFVQRARTPFFATAISYNFSTKN